MNYRLATADEIRKAAKGIEQIEDTEDVYAYSREIFGPDVARVRLTIDHNFDDGEETRYIATHHAHHRAWDAQGNVLPMITSPDDVEAPSIHRYEPWHMEFDFFSDKEKEIVKLYVKEA